MIFGLHFEVRVCEFVNMLQSTVILMIEWNRGDILQISPSSCSARRLRPVSEKQHSIQFEHPPLVITWILQGGNVNFGN